VSGLCGVPGLVAALGWRFGLLSLCICLVLGAECIPTLCGGQGLAPKEDVTMTLRELLAKVKPTGPSLVAKIRETLSSKALPEHQVYQVQSGSKWATVIQDLCISLDDMEAVGVTGYGTGPEFFEALRSALSDYIMEPLLVDDQGWRRVYACASSEDSKAFLLCANWYPESRQSVKARFNKTNTADNPNDTQEPADIELDSDSGDPFA